MVNHVVSFSIRSSTFQVFIRSIKTHAVDRKCYHSQNYKNLKRKNDELGKEITCVASQIVLKLMKCSFTFSTPNLRIMVFSTSFPGTMKIA